MNSAMSAMTRPNAAGGAAAAIGSAKAVPPAQPERRIQVLERSAVAPNVRKTDRNFPEPNPAVTVRAHDSTGETT